MRISNQQKPIAEGDLTPMIDMVFQLIAFFMVLVNFSNDERREQIQLPSSAVARPAEGKLDFPITMHVEPNGYVYLGGEPLTIETLRIGLNRELAVLKSQGRSSADANVIIRADRNTAAGNVQEVVRVSQESGFERFALRVKEQILP
jgi:biopolymer transport protein ExbD